MRVTRLEIGIGAALLAVIVGAVLFASLDDEPDFDGLAEAQDDQIIFRIDVSAAYDDSDAGAGPDGWTEFPIRPEHVVTGEPSLVLSASTDSSFGHLQMLFDGYWPQSGGFPIVLNDEGTIVFSQAAPGRNGNQLTRVRFPGNVESVGVMTFIMGECTGESHLPSVAVACEAKGASPG